MLFDTGGAVRCLDGPTENIRAAAAGVLAGMADAHCGLHDALLEAGADLMTPFAVGQRYLICTVTLYYVGEVAESSFGFLRLKDASWVHWTGRLSVLTAQKKFTGKEFGDRKPRVEPVGEVILAVSTIVSAYPGKWELPEKAL